MNLTGLAAYLVFVVTSVLVLVGCWRALRRDDRLQTVLRLTGLVLYVAGCTVAASGRVLATIERLPLTVLVGVLIADVGACVLMVGLSRRVSAA